MHTAACKELYANLTMFHYKKKEVARSRVTGVEIEFDSLRLASILGVPGNNGICEYIKEVWEESKYIKPLEITRKFVNDDMITVARRVRSAEMKPFQRFMHFVVMKNVAPRFGKRDTTSFMDLTYMDHLTTRRLVNFAESYDETHDHELPYGDWMTMIFEAFDVPLIDKQGAEPKSGENRRRDDEEAAPVENEEVNEEVEVQNDFDWEAVVDEAALQGESGPGEKFYDAEDEVQEPTDVIVQDPVTPATFPASLADSSTVQKETTPAGVDPSGLTGSIPDSMFLM
ncbi:hypothetical protein Dimus_003080 [Dionaea muscipula]